MTIKSLVAILASASLFIGLEAFSTRPAGDATTDSSVELRDTTHQKGKRGGQRPPKDSLRGKKGGQRPPKDSLRGGQRPPRPDSLKGHGQRPQKKNNNSKSYSR